MSCSVDRTNYKIKMPLPPKIDPSVTMMQVEEKPDVTYDDIGGCKEQIDKLREVVEMPLLNVSVSATRRAALTVLKNVVLAQPERFVELGIDPPKGVMLYGKCFVLTTHS